MRGPVNPVKRLIDIAMRETRIVAGLMSGTSADGVDIAIMEITGSGRGVKYRILGKGVEKYPSGLRSMILRTLDSGGLHDVCALNFLIARFFAKAFENTREVLGIKRGEIDLVGSHGQTVYHFPEFIRIDDLVSRCTLQLGSVQVVAEDTGIITIGNFRVRDIAAGGMGAPIIAYVDYALLSSPNTGRAIQNIGGIANVTVLPPDPSIDSIYAFDTGPGNSLIDYAVSILYGDMEYDPDGEIASRGSPDPEILEELMGHPFIRAPPPKTTGREVFGKSLVLRVIERARAKGLSREDIVATLTMYTVESIIYNYKEYILPRVKIGEVIVGGGGTRNKTMMGWLRKHLESLGLRVLVHEDLGIDSKIKEAMGMALLAHETLNGVPNNVPGATGALRRVVMGEIAL